MTWLEIQIGEEENRTAYGRARVAIVHTGASGDTMREVLDEESFELAALYDHYFDGGSLKSEFGRPGTDLLFVDEMELQESHTGRNIELAVIRRLCDTICRGCAIAVVSCETAEAAELWQRMGFAVTPGAGMMHMSMALAQPRVCGPNETGRFWTVMSGSGKVEE